MADMKNLSMAHKLKNDEALDVSECRRTPEGYYILNHFWEGSDYCDAVTESWIWSIGRRKNDGVILASTTSIFYDNCDFECLWLR